MKDSDLWTYGTDPCACLAVDDTRGVLKKKIIERRTCGPLDVRIKILYSGICHSDLHQIRAEWEQNVWYPMVPGHEGAGIVEEVGPEVKKFKKGDRVGVGVMVGSCRECDACKSELQQYCEKGFWGSYNHCLTDASQYCTKNCEKGELLFGTYTSIMTVREDFVFRIADSLPLDRAGPLLCAGITTWDPLVHFGAKAGGKNFKVGVMGFGGLGHMAIKFAKSFGNDVYVLSRSKRKEPWAKEMGVNFVLTTGSLKGVPGLDLIIDTVSAQHDVDRFIGRLLKTDGKLCLVGLPANALEIRPFTIVGGRKAFVGSCIGGCQSTQDMLDYCAENQIMPDVQVIHPREANAAMKMLSEQSNPKARFVIDCREMDKEGWETENVDFDYHSWEVHKGATVWPEESNWHEKNPDPNKEATESTSESKCPLSGVPAMVGALAVGIFVGMRLAKRNN